MADITKPENVTPFAACTCAKCGPPWRDGTDAWKTEGPFGFGASWMTLCPECGNKRCPGAVDHTLPCSHSNDSEENAKAWARIRENGYRGASPGFVETTPEGVKLVHWFDNDGNEHINGMGVWPE